jgi:hypothetical protein
VAKRPNTLPGWRPLGGKSRNYLNEETGEVLSRRQYDKLYGALARAGVASYEAKAKRTPDELRRTRPAPGRAKAGNYQPPPARLRGLRPPRNHLSRRISAGRTAAEYDRVLRGLRHNGAINGIGVIAVYNLDGHEKFVWLQDVTFPGEVIDGAMAAESIGLYDTGDIESEIAYEQGKLEAYEEADNEAAAIATQARLDELIDRYEAMESGELGLGQASSVSVENFVNFAFHIRFDTSVFVAKPEKKKKKAKRKVMAQVRDEKGRPVFTESGRPKLRKRKKSGKKAKP